MFESSDIFQRLLKNMCSTLFSVFAQCTSSVSDLFMRFELFIDPKTRLIIPGELVKLPHESSVISSGFEILG